MIDNHALAGQSADRKPSLEDLLGILRRTWWIIALCVAIGGGVAVVLSKRQPTTYTASSLLLFQDPGFQQAVFGGNSTFQPDTDPSRAAATNIELSSLPIVAGLTAKALGIDPGLVSGEVSVGGVGQADMAQVNVSDTDPVRAARIANAYAREYILYRQSADRATISGAEKLVANDIASLTPAQRAGVVGSTLHNRQNQLQILAALQTGNAELAQPATVPSAPSGPSTKRNAILGCLLGLLVGMGLAFVRERLDHRIRELDELEECSGVPLLGVIPPLPALSTTGRAPLPAGAAEAIALLRGRLRYFNADRDVQSLLLTSAMPGEGKSVVALQLAIAEAAAGNSKVVLVEADFRHPVLANRLGIEAAPGVTEVLSRTASLDSAIRRVKLPSHGKGSRDTVRISVLPAGLMPSNPAEMLESRVMTDLLSSLAERFDLIIIDTPPASVVSDAMPLMRRVSGVMIVSRPGQVTRGAMRHLREELEKLRAPTLGVVANGVTNGDSPYGYAYYERNGDSRPKSRERKKLAAAAESVEVSAYESPPSA